MKHKKNTVKTTAEPAGYAIKSTWFDNLWISAGAMLVLALILFNRGLLSSVMIYGSDFVAGGYMTRSFISQSIRDFGAAPLWDPYIFGGVPSTSVGTMSGDYWYYPMTVLYWLQLKPQQIVAFSYFLHLLLAGVGTYLFLKNERFSGAASFVSGISYMFTSSVASLIYAGHDAKIAVSAMLPWLLLFIGKAVNTRKILWALLAGLTIGMSLMTPHVQMTYYLLLAGFFFALAKLYAQYKATRNRNDILKAAGLGLLVLSVGFSLYAVQALTLQDYMKLSARGQDKGYAYATSYSMPPEELINIAWPEFSGLIDKDSEGRPTHWYWGRRDLKLHTEYIGVLALLLAAIGLACSPRKKIKLFFILLGVFALIVAFGGFTPLYYIVYYLIPGMSKFRSPAMIFNLFAFSASVMAALGVQALMDGHGGKQVIRNLMVSLGVVLVLGLILSLAKDGVTQALTVFAAKGWGAQALWQSYGEMIRGYWISLMIFLIGILLAWLLVKHKIHLSWWSLVTGLLIFIELWRVDARFIKLVSPQDYFAKDQVVQKLEKDRSIYRVMPLQVHQTGNYLKLFNIQTVGGENPNPLRRYNEYLGTNPQRLLPDYHNVLDLNGLNFMNILGVKYLLMQQPINHPDFTLYDTCYGGQVMIYQNRRALPRAWLVSDFEVINNDRLILERIKQSGFDPARNVILEETPQEYRAEGTADGTISFNEYQPNRVSLTVEAKKPALMVMSENHYPAWKAYVDGNETKVYRADYTFRAIALPAGLHKVEFKYHSKIFETGKAISLISLLLVLAGILTLGTREIILNRRMAKT